MTTIPAVQEASKRDRRFFHALFSAVALAALSLAILAPGALARVGYVTNADSENVSAFDTQTNLVVGSPIPVGERPGAIAITPDDATAYVANAQSDTVSAINVHTNQVVGSPIPVGEDPDAIAITPDGTTAYVANRESHTVSAIDTRTNHVVGSPIPVGEGPDAIAIAPGGGAAYVANAESDTLSVIDTRTDQVVGLPIAAGEFPRAIAIAPDGKTAYVADEISESVAVIDLQTNHVVGAPIAVGKSPKAIAIAPNGGTAYVANQISNTISVIDAQTDQVTGSPIHVSGHPEAITITPDGGTAYFTVEGSSVVSAIDTRTNQVVVPATIVAGTSAFEIAITPDQPPLASFFASSTSVQPGVPISFDASASSDPDGTIAGYAWSFGDGQTATGPAPTHTYSAPGTYRVTLTLTDNEGCSTSFVFTGQIAYCNGSAQAAQTQTVVVFPSNNFRFRRLTRNKHNGTAKLRVYFPAAGTLTLTSKQVRAIQRKVRKAMTVTLTLRPKRMLNKALKHRHHARARIRVSFTPTGGSQRTKAKTLELIRRR